MSLKSSGLVIIFLVLILEIFLSSAQTTGSPSQPIYSNSYCSATDNQGNCISCVSGLAIWGTNCVELASLNSFCLNFNGIVCTNCKTGYVLMDGVCTYANPNCGLYDIAGGCINCIHGYLSVNMCLIPSNCLKTNQNGNCISCQNGFIIWGTNCISLQSLYPFCSTFANNLCTACNYGYFLNSGRCLFANPFCTTFDQKGSCLSCSEGYVLSGTFCVVSSTVCNITNPITNICSSCNTGFVLSGISCVAQVTLNPFCLVFNGAKCLFCVTGYYTNNGICIYPTYRCLTSNPTTKKCLSCYPKYFLTNGQCLPVSPLCNGNALDGSCTKCFSGYTIKGGVCVTLISINPFCLAFRGQTCVNCQRGYYIGPNTLCLQVNPLCKTYFMNSGICIKCVNGSSISNGNCFAWNVLNPQCANFNNVTGNCFGCKKGYYLGPKTICLQVSSLCRTYSMLKGICYQCITGYTLSNGSCIVSVVHNPQCANFNLASGNCLGCKNGYYLGPNTICLKVSSLCKTYSMLKGICYQCVTGHTLSNGSCIVSVVHNPNCANFNIASGNCLGCKNGYYLGPKTVCLQVSSLCKSYSMLTGNCYSCVARHSLSNGKCQPWSYFNPECLTFDDTNGNCLNCSNGYYIGPNSICVQVIPNCDEYIMSSGVCLSCKIGYSMSLGNCVSFAVLNPNCEQFDTDGTCLKCSNGYFIGFQSFCTKESQLPSNNLTHQTHDMVTGNGRICVSGYSMMPNGSCVAWTDINPQCQQFDDANGNCLNCYYGYYLGSNTLCLQVNYLCDTYQMDSGKCLSCIDGYTIVGQDCFATINNCDKYTSVGQCQTCNTAFTLVDQSCFATINNCDKYTSVGQCQTCNTAFTLVDQSCFATINNCDKYTSVGQCQTCNTAFTLVDQSCFATINNCDKYTSVGQCQTCNTAFTLVDQSCFATINNCDKYTSVGQCQTCNTAFTLVDQSCFATINNCDKYTSVGQCQTCNTAFTLVDQSCFATINNCDKYTSVGQCQTCNTAFTLVDQSCFATINNCDKYTSVGQCQTCNTAFTLVDQSCFATINNCDKYTSVGQCQTCNTAFTLVDQSCFATINNCDKYTSVGQCQTCNTAFTLVDQSCFATIINCDKYTSVGQCQTCNTAFTLVDQSCFATINNCDKYTSVGQCQTCNTAFTLVDQSCFATIINCANYTSTGQCTNCIANYSLLGQQCVSWISLNPQCNKFSSTGDCLNCTDRYYLGLNTQCTNVSSLCVNYDMNSGNCTSCIQGYIFLVDYCQSLSIYNPKCLTFNNISCTKCSSRYYIGPSTICSQVSSTCDNYQMDTGNCVTCILGYGLLNNSCLSWATLNPYCLQFDNTNGNCLNCTNRYFIDTNYICSPVSSLCNTYQMNSGMCLSCITGYVYLNYTCISAALLNPNCLRFSNITCITCKDRFYLGTDSNCTAVNVLCADYSMSTGICLNCITGYQMFNNNSACISAQVIASNVWCTYFNISICTWCTSKYYIGPSGICILANAQCKKYDMYTGDCTDCNSGWATLTDQVTNRTTCVQTTSGNPYCIAFVGVTCVKCFTRYYVGLNSTCTAVNQTCKDYVMKTGACLNCYPGWNFANGSCGL